MRVAKNHPHNFACILYINFGECLPEIMQPPQLRQPEIPVANIAPTACAKNDTLIHSYPHIHEYLLSDGSGMSA